MKKVIAGIGIMVMLGCFGSTVFAEKKPSKAPGEAKFKELCALCHPDGGNIVNPKKTLHKKDRELHNVKTEEDIIKNMRTPGPGMTKFDKKILSDKDAADIAKYIIMTFN